MNTTQKIKKVLNKTRKALSESTAPKIKKMKLAVPLIESVSEPLIEENYKFTIYGMGCMHAKMDKKTEAHASSKIKYNAIYNKCYEKESEYFFGKSSSVLATIGDRALNPFNKPHKDFSNEIRDTLSYLSEHHETKGGVIKENTASRKTPKETSRKSIKKTPTEPVQDIIKEKPRETIEGVIKVTESLLEKVKKRLLKNKSGRKSVNVYVFGHSYGGLILNRLCEELQIIANNDAEFKEILKKHFKALGLNSIYLADSHNIPDVNLINYMNIGDVALRLNKFELLFRKPSMQEFEQKSVVGSIMHIKYMYIPEHKFVWYNDAGMNEPNTTYPNMIQYFVGNQDEWKRHNSRTNVINMVFTYTGENIPM